MFSNSFVASAVFYVGAPVLLKKAGSTICVTFGGKSQKESSTVYSLFVVVLCP